MGHAEDQLRTSFDMGSTRNLVATFMMFIVPTRLVQAGAITVVFATSLLGWVAYKLLFERGRIDVLSRPRGQ
jgi:hypothetical protein